MLPVVIPILSIYLQQHHLVPRSCGGSDDNTNKITLCCICHGKWHGIERDNSHKALIAAGMRRAQAKGTKSGKPIGRPALPPRSKTLSVRLTRPGERPCAVLPSDSMSVSRLSGAVLHSGGCKSGYPDLQIKQDGLPPSCFFY